MKKPIWLRKINEVLGSRLMTPTGLEPAFSSCPKIAASLKDLSGLFSTRHSNMDWPVDQVPQFQ